MYSTTNLHSYLEHLFLHLPASGGGNCLVPHLLSFSSPDRNDLRFDRSRDDYFESP